jgi:hypothetical protein
LLVRRSFASELDRRGNEDASGFFVVPKIGLLFFLRAVSRAFRQDPDFQKMIRVQINKAYVSILPNHLQLVRGRSVDVLSSEVFDIASLCLPINQCAVDLGVFYQRLDVIGRHAFGIFAPEKW